MKRSRSVYLHALLRALLVLSLVASITACSDQTGPSGSSSESGSEISQTQSTPSDTPEPSPSPTPEPELFVPGDIFGSKLDPYSDVAFPDNFNVYGAAFDVGIEKIGGKPHFTLSMTAEGKTEESIIYLAELADLEDEQVLSSHIEGFLSYGFCEFESPDGSVFTIRKTDQNDDRYEYVDGLHADIWTTVPEEDAPDYLQLLHDSFNVNALSAPADYFDVTPLFGESTISVNLHKKEVRMDMCYPVSDVETVWNKITENLKFNWFDSENAKLGFSYGIFNIELLMDKQGGNIYVTEMTYVTDSVLSAYTEPEVSLSKLGFGFDQENICGVYEQREPHYMSVAVHRPEWGKFNDDWNIEFMDQVNGYGLRITYMEAEDKFRISADKDGTSAVYEYFIKSGNYDGDYPDKETVTRVFNDVFETTGEDFYDEPIEHFERLVQDRFGMSVLELYELPAK